MKNKLILCDIKAKRINVFRTMEFVPHMAINKTRYILVLTTYISRMFHLITRAFFDM